MHLLLVRAAAKRKRSSTILTAVRHLIPILIILVVTTSALPTMGAAPRTKRILIVGDSWAASISAENRDGFPAPDVFDDTLKANGLGAFETQGKLTAWGGRKASDWAKPKHLAEIRSELLAYPSIDIVHLIVGGNDFLGALNQADFAGKTAEERKVVWDAVARNIQSIVDTCQSVRKDIRVVIADYDYLDHRAAEQFWKMNFHGASVREVNSWFVELGEAKRDIAVATPQCEYIDNWGTLQYWFGEPPRNVPLPGGNLDAPMPKGISPDGIHPNADAHAKLIQNAIDQCYKAWLSTP